MRSSTAARPASRTLPWYRRPLVRSLGLALGAMLLYGGWAYFANRAHGQGAALRAAGTQGFISLTLTFVVTALMEGLHRLGSRRSTRFLLPAGGAILFGAIYSTFMHRFMGTPEMTRTILPIVLIGATYTLSYSANLVRESAADERAGEKADKPVP